MSESAFSVFLFGLGAVTLLGMGRILPFWYIAATALPIGALIWAVIVLLSSMLGVAQIAWLVAAFVFLAMGRVVCVDGCLALRTRETVSWLGGALIIVLVSSYVLHALSVTVVSYDSITQIIFGKALVENMWDPDVTLRFASWGVFVPLLQGSSILIGVDYLSSFQGLLGLSLVAILFGSLWEVCRESSDSFRRCAFVVWLCVMLIVSSYFFIFQSTYVHNSLPSALFLFLAIHGLWKLVSGRNEKWARLVLFGLIGFTLCRTEAPLFAAVLLGITLCDSKICLDRRIAISIVLPYAGFVAAWYSFLYFVTASGTDILDSVRITGLIAIVLGVATAAMLKEYAPFSVLTRYLPNAILWAAISWLVFYVLFRFDHAARSIISVFENLAIEGRWGVTWWILGIVSMLTLSIWRSQGDRFILRFIVVFIALVLALGSMRAPYRLGWGDSANRIFTHILPALVFLLVIRLRATPDLSRFLFNRKAVTLVATALVGFCLGVVSVAWGYRFEDAAREAVVIGAEGFCPPDNGGRHDFDVALRGVVDDKYAAACSKGEQRIILDLKQMVKADFIEMVAYSDGERPTGFAFEVSPDGIKWQVLYDTNPAVTSLSRTEMRADIIMRIPTQMLPEFRFLRFTYRESLGQNRLLLRKLSVMTRPGWGFPRA